MIQLDKLKVFTKFFNVLLFVWTFTFPKNVFAFPIYAQQTYENPREANGRIVCANCHLAQKPISLKTPSAVVPNSIFETILQIPFDDTKTQILEGGKRGDINVGAIVILPEGFKLAPKKLLSKDLKLKTKDAYITPYSSQKDNILVVGPVLGKKNKEIIFPVISPDPLKNKNVHFAKYPIYGGANRGRAQVNPNGEKTNNNAIFANYSGKIENIIETEKESIIVIALFDNTLKEQKIPKGLEIIVKKDDLVTQDQALTLNPNMGGFGQTEVGIVLQNPTRIYGYLSFCFSIILAQSMLVFKKKQFEKVQIADIDF